MVPGPPSLVLGCLPKPDKPFSGGSALSPASPSRRLSLDSINSSLAGHHGNLPEGWVSPPWGTLLPREALEGQAFQKRGSWARKRGVPARSGLGRAVPAGSGVGGRKGSPRGVGGQGSGVGSAVLPGNHKLPTWEAVLFGFTCGKTQEGHARSSPQHHSRHTLTHPTFPAHLLCAGRWET